jgi:hypothetical protein
MEKNKINKELIENVGRKYDEYKETQFNLHKKIANKQLVDSQKERNKKIDKKSIVLDSLMIDGRLNNNLIDVLMADKDNQCDSPKHKIPEVKAQLHVIKPIGSYEPAIDLDYNENKNVKMDPDERPTNKIITLSDKMNKNQDRKEVEMSVAPKTHKEKRDCEMDLDGNDLQKIQVSSKEIDFGEVFRNSEKFKTFWVKNNLRNHIFVQIETDLLELKKR